LDHFFLTVFFTYLAADSQQEEQIQPGPVELQQRAHSLSRLGGTAGSSNKPEGYRPLILFLNVPEHLNVTTFLGASIMASPVAGFRPLRSFFSFTQNLPNPETSTSSPDARVLLMISKRVSTISDDLFLGKPVWLWTDSTI